MISVGYNSVCCSQEEFETRIPIPGTGKVKRGLKHAFFVWIENPILATRGRLRHALAWQQIASGAEASRGARAR
jgi:hypothetical protein